MSFKKKDENIDEIFEMDEFDLLEAMSVELPPLTEEEEKALDDYQNNISEEDYFGY